jgi:glutamine synthetase
MLDHDSSPVNPRFSTLKSIAEPGPRKTHRPGNGAGFVTPPISEYFGELTFGLGHMREKLPKEDYQALVRTLENGKKFSPDVADSIALVVKEWAVTKGATHFCHWFQPMTGLTAEKHDAFISIQHTYHSELSVIERFTGSQLIQGEPDASSFPSGGMRSTFEARGYTAWDPSSPLFLIEGELGLTLCIPTVFFGYHGQALDHKTPLLRSAQVLSKEACEFLKLVGDVDVKAVNATLGCEQEYFLIDRRFAQLRPDLVMTGRTLLGAASPRGQQLEDHYFGAIPSRVKTFMEDLEIELYRLGVPIKTRHNEVAPSQFELAPIFENAVVAADHNTLTMETLKRVANRHGLMCLLYEKPFAGINGSGKHCNWSISNDKGENLLDPGSTPHQNLRFLAVTSIVLKAVHDHSDAIRASIATPGNDHRLGGNEAPPAIISVFLGSFLSRIFDAIEKGEAAQATEAQIINLGASSIPDISKDYTDRNRTSPFAFTGNKFEFRAVGASANVSVPISTLNAAIAESFHSATQRLKALLSTKGRDEAVMELIRSLAKESKAVRFEGNNYSEEWQKEAKKRGLPVLSSTAEALEVFRNPKSVEFLINTKVLTKDEIESRYHIAVERYVKTIEIELNTLLEMVNVSLVPAVEAQIVRVTETNKALTSAPLKKLHSDRVQGLEAVFEEMLKQLKSVHESVATIHTLESESEKMKMLAQETVPIANKLRKACDLAETLVADDLWPLPKYREMLFSHATS